MHYAERQCRKYCYLFYKWRGYPAMELLIFIPADATKPALVFRDELLWEPVCSS